MKKPTGPITYVIQKGHDVVPRWLFTRAWWHAPRMSLVDALVLLPLVWLVYRLLWALLVLAINA